MMMPGTVRAMRGFVQPCTDQGGEEADRERAEERRRRQRHAEIMQREAQLVADERQAPDRKYGARRAVVEDRKAAAAGEACNRAQPKRRGFAQIRAVSGVTRSGRRQQQRATARRRPRAGPWSRKPAGQLAASV